MAWEMSRVKMRVMQIVGKRAMVLLSVLDSWTAWKCPEILRDVCLPSRKIKFWMKVIILKVEEEWLEVVE